MPRFQPKLFTTLQQYDRRQFLRDAVSGVVVGIVALPLAIAFGIASGVSPEKGLVTAIVAGFLVSAFGGSRVQIGGPTGAFVVIVYGIVHHYGTDGLITATLLAGLFLVVMGAAGLGRVISYIPRPVIVGFTAGIAVIIFSSQVKDFFGLRIDVLPADFAEKWRVLTEHFGTWNPAAAALAAGTVAVTALWPRVTHRVPGSLIAIIAGAAAVKLLGLPVETIGTRFGALPTTLPAPQLPALSLERVQELAQPAFTIALLAGIESLLSAVVADGMTGGRHRPNTELVAQGVANVGSALFGGIPATGAIARTVTNIKSGGRTPVAGIVHALTLLVILFAFGRWAVHIPLACLAGILVVVAYHMSEWRSFASILRSQRSEALILAVTFLLTVVVDLTVAIEVGVVLAALLFVRRMTTATSFSVAQDEMENERIDLEAARVKVPLPPGVEVYEISGPFFFGVANEFEETTRFVSGKPRARVLRLERVPFIDMTALHALEQLHRRSVRDGVKIVLVGARPEPLRTLRASGLLDALGPGGAAATLDEALSTLRPAH